MTCDQIDTDHWRLSFARWEGDFVISTLARLGHYYQADLSQMPPALRAYWEGKITRREEATADGTRESQEMMAEARAELRSERLALVENWVREFELAEERDPWKVDVTGAERDEFVAMLNDRRLLLALELGITEADMEADPDHISKEERRRAIWEIDFLGHIILLIIGPQIYRP